MSEGWWRKNRWPLRVTPEEFSFFQLELGRMRNAGSLPLLLRCHLMSLDRELREEETPSSWSHPCRGEPLSWELVGRWGREWVRTQAADSRSLQVLVDLPEHTFLHLLCALRMIPEPLNNCLFLVFTRFARFIEEQVHGLRMVPSQKLKS